MSETGFVRQNAATGVMDAGTAVKGRRQVQRPAPTQTLDATQSGERFVGAVDAVFTLPLASTVPDGTFYEFECGVPSSGTGLSISPNAADYVRGNGLTATVNKDLINSGASDRIGDAVTVMGNGADGWMITAIIGTWAKEA